MYIIFGGWVDRVAECSVVTEINFLRSISRPRPEDLRPRPGPEPRLQGFGPLPIPTPRLGYSGLQTETDTTRPRHCIALVGLIFVF